MINKKILKNPLENPKVIIKNKDNPVKIFIKVFVCPNFAKCSRRFIELWCIDQACVFGYSGLITMV